MALRALMLKKKIDTTRQMLDKALEKRTELEKREAELEQSISEAETEEEKATVEEAVADYEKEKAENDAEVSELEQTLNNMEQELAEDESKQEPPAPDAPKTEERTKKETKIMRRKFFGLDHEERTRFLENEHVKSFLERTRELIKEKRAVSGAELTIPTEVLALIRQNISLYSKLIKKVRAIPVAGKARQTVMGVIPEAVWTEMCAKLNELDFSFGAVEVDGYKVGGFIPICNSVLEDSDEDLAAIIIDAIAQAIGYALDKAILFGTGTKMPKGIFTRLSETADPEDDRRPSTLEWKDLHETNIITIPSGKTGVDLFKAFILASGKASSDYARGDKFWALNENTLRKLQAEALSINAAGAIVSGVNNTMPVVGGEYVTLNFIPDDVIIGGYGELYLLAQRAGGKFAQSEHVRFIEDQTVFKGTARYDGCPVFGEGFVAIGLGVAPSAAGISFAPDSANP